MRRSLRTTTALLAGFAMVSPTVVPAQQQSLAIQCPTDPTMKCDSGTMELLEDQSIAFGEVIPGEAGGGAMAPEAGASAEPEAQPVAEQPAQAPQTQVPQTTEQQPAPESAQTLSAQDLADQLNIPGVSALVDAIQPDVAAPPPAAASAEADADAEVTEEVVTEDTARSSDEDFSGGIDADATAAAPEAGRSGLSKFEKALLLGAGALAVGAIVRGNREVVSTSDDRVVVSRSDGTFEVIKDDNALLRQPGNNIETQTFSDGSTRTVTKREDGSQVVTIRDADLRVIRRSLIRTDGSEVLLIDDTAVAEPVDIASLPRPAPQIETSALGDDDDALRRALQRQGVFDRRFSLSQVRQIKQVRDLAPAITVDSINFETGSAAIRPEEAEKLSRLGRTIARMIEDNPNEVFLVEGHTDAVGSASTNLILSDRRAESLALALTEYFGVPPENLVVQGYGESDLKVQTEAAERANRRAGLRRITDLLQVASR